MSMVVVGWLVGSGCDGDGDGRGGLVRKVGGGLLGKRGEGRRDSVREGVVGGEDGGGFGVGLFADSEGSGVEAGNLSVLIVVFLVPWRVL